MKKIAFFVQQMLCGGVENALISLSGKLRDEGHQVTIYVIQKTGAFIDKVPDGVQLRQSTLYPCILLFLARISRAV